MAKEKNMEEKKEETKKAAKPKIFYKKDERIEVVVTGYYDLETGELQFVLPGKIEDEEKNFTRLHHVFRFSPVTYDSLCAYRQNCLVKYTDELGKVQAVIDDVKLNKHLWTYHLKDWNFEDEKGKITLTTDPNGALSDESFDRLYSVPSGILDKAIQIYRRRMSID